jgi:regulator of sigma E protease
VNWVLVFVGFSTLIILHEFGHFLAAKWTGMRVERFFLFFPPKLWSIKRGETEYGIGAIPLGGFVKITGMNPDDLEPRPPEEGETPNDILTRIESSGQDPEEDRLPDGRLKPEVAARAYYAQPVWKRIVVIAAGPAVNLLLAFAILFALGFGVKQATTVEVAQIDDDSPAATALEEGDQLLAIDGVQLNQGGSRPSDDELTARAEAFANQLNTHTCAGEQTDGCVAAKPATLTIERDGQTETVTVAPTYDADAPPLEEGEDPGRYRLGFAFQGGELVSSGYSAGEAATWAVDRMWTVATGTVSTMAQLFKPEKREEISGVVGISAVGNEVIDFGAWEAFALLALVSLSLAIINLFPFLPLDGGHIFWSLVEKFRGQRVPFSVMERASAIGFVLILFLFFIGLSNDIDRLTGEGFELGR